MLDFTLFDVLGCIEVFYFSGNCRLIAFCIKTGNRRNAILTRCQTFPEFRYGIADRCHGTDTGNDNTFHRFSSFVHRQHFPYSAVLPSTDSTCPVM